MGFSYLPLPISRWLYFILFPSGPLVPGVVVTSFRVYRARGCKDQATMWVRVLGLGARLLAWEHWCSSFLRPQMSESEVSSGSVHHGVMSEVRSRIFGAFSFVLPAGTLTSVKHSVSLFWACFSALSAFSSQVPRVPPTLGCCFHSFLYLPLSPRVS